MAVVILMVVELGSCSWIGRWPQSLCFVRRSRLVEAPTDSWRNARGERAPKGVVRGLFCRSFMVWSELCYLGSMHVCEQKFGFAVVTPALLFALLAMCFRFRHNATATTVLWRSTWLTSSSHNRYHVLFDSWVFFRLRKSRFERFVSSSFSFLSFQQIPVGTGCLYIHELLQSVRERFENCCRRSWLSDDTEANKSWMEPPPLLVKAAWVLFKNSRLLSFRWRLCVSVWLQMNHPGSCINSNRVSFQQPSLTDTLQSCINSRASSLHWEIGSEMWYKLLLWGLDRPTRGDYSCRLQPEVQVVC